MEQSENGLFDLRLRHPGKYLRDMMDAKGWTQDELAAITGMSRQTVNNLVSGKSNITPETAVKLSVIFGNKAEEWLKWDNLFRLSQVETDTALVGRLARLYEIAPVRDMQKRGWIKLTGDLTELESEMTRFFGANPLDADIVLPIAPRRTVLLPNLNAAEKAWCFRARQLAAMVQVKPFSPSKLSQTEKRLRQLAAFPKETRHIPKVLAECGIRFMVIEPLPGARIDGATMWLDGGPAIAVSLRHDRIDGFWFTLMHEFAHVRNGDASVDTELVDGIKGVAVKLVEDESEDRANEAASDSLISRAELNSFIRRVGPFYPRQRVIQFANKVKIHPGIIVGQLQHKNEIGYGSLREFLVKVRESVTSTALTDGWSHTISPNLA